MTDINNTVTVITPTTGKNSLFNLIESMLRQGFPINHIVLWDDKREGQFADMKIKPDALEVEEYSKNYNYNVNNIVMKGSMVQGAAYGSALRAIGLMAANSEFVTFADDDVMWEANHLTSMLLAMQDKNWAFCKRKIWTTLPDGKYELLGVDEFESVGEEAITPYKMVDNNCLMFRRRFGVSAACLYRETTAYDDDRLFYDFMKKYGGEPAKTNLPTINQVCPEKLIEFFRKYCTK